MKLYFAPRTRSVRPRWILEELEVPYDLVKVDLSTQENRTPGFLALNPLGEVPVLLDGDATLFGSPAICLYLADRFPEKRLAPSPASPERGPYLQWLLFAEATLDPLVVEFFWNAQLPEDKKADLTKQKARLDEVLAIVENQVSGRDFIAGSAFTAADIVMTSILHLANTLKLLDPHPKLTEYVLRHSKRPAAGRAVAG